MTRRAWPLLFLMPLAGCFSPPTRVDPFAGLVPPAAADVSFKTLTLGLIVSQNTKNALGYARQGSALTLGAFDPNEPFDQAVAMLRAHFKQVYKVDSMEQARAAGADVVGVFDYYAAPPSFIWGHAKIDATLALMTLDGAALDTARGKGDVKGTEGAGMLGQTRIINATKMAEEQALGQLKAALEGSQALRALESGTTRPAASAPAAAVTPVSDVDAPGYKRPEDPERFAIVIGIEKYATLPAADFAEHDARAVRDHLRALGYPDRNIVLLTGAQAGRAGIEKYLESWLPRNSGPGSRVLVFFSGHGAPNPVTGQAYLVPWDGDPKFLENTGYPLSRLYEKLGALKAKEIVVALDACFSGAGGRSVLAQGVRPLVAKIEPAASGRVVVLAASAGDEITGVSNEQGHGLFTYYLLKGLNERRGAASLKTLFQYLRPQVQDAARRDNREQTPELAPADGAGLAL